METKKKLRKDIESLYCRIDELHSEVSFNFDDLASRVAKVTQELTEIVSNLSDRLSKFEQQVCSPAPKQTPKKKSKK